MENASLVSSYNQYIFYLDLLSSIQEEKTMKFERLKERKNIYIEFLKKEFRPEENIEVDYPAIYLAVQKKKPLTDEVEILDNILKEIETDLKCENTDLTNKVKRIRRHFKLSFEQLRSLEDTKRTLTESIQKEQQEQSAKLKKEMLQVERKNYINFVTILGIFTAIVATLFGSISFASSFFNEKLINTTDRFLLYIALTSLLLIIILYSLMKWINNIIHKKSPTTDWFLIGIGLIFLIIAGVSFFSIYL